MNRGAFLFAVGTALLGIVLLLLYQRRFELEVSGGSRVRVLSAIKTIPRGSVVTEETLSIREVPQAYYEDRMIREADKARVLGLRIGNSVRAQQTLLWTDLIAASDERRDLSSVVQPGSRAVSIRTGREDTQLALIRPGDYVDVIGTFPGPGETRAAAVLLQKVLVLATTTNFSADVHDKERGELLLTVSVTIPEAQMLALALERGRLMVALRNPDDPKTGDRLPDLVSSTVTDPKERSQIKGVRGPTRLEKDNE